jgi:hypothetical protein
MSGHFRTTRKRVQGYQSPASHPSTERFENFTSFRDRLRSLDDTPIRPQKKQRLERPDPFFNVYEQLGACFALEPSPPSTTATRLPTHMKEKAASPSDVGLAKQFTGKVRGAYLSTNCRLQALDCRGLYAGWRRSPCFRFGEPSPGSESSYEKDVCLR